MKTVTAQNCDYTKLHEELLAQGIKIIDLSNDALTGHKLARNIWIKIEDSEDEQLVMSIIDAHDPTPIPEPPTLEAQLAEKDAQILKLKEEQFKTQQMANENAETQQGLIELLMDMGVI